MDVDEYLAKLRARLPEGTWSPWDPLMSTAEQRKLIDVASAARADVLRLEAELRQARAQLRER